MFVIAVFLVGIAGATALVCYMASHVESEAIRLEHEVQRIRRQAERGWSTRRILRHHHRFCRCQIDYLRRSCNRPTWAH